MKQSIKLTKERPPEIFRPILWSLRWEDIDMHEDKDDIIVNTINEGNLVHWRWIIKVYGKENVKQVLLRHLQSEFHPESRALAQVVFSFPRFSHAQRSAH